MSGRRHQRSGTDAIGEGRGREVEKRRRTRIGEGDAATLVREEETEDRV
jgi:hypothetical protein